MAVVFIKPGVPALKGHLCVSTPEAINNQWYDMDPYDWLNKFYRCYKANVVGIIDGRGLGINMHHGKLMQ